MLTTQGTPAPGPSAEADAAPVTPTSREPSTDTRAVATSTTLGRLRRAARWGLTRHLAMERSWSRGRSATSRPVLHPCTPGASRTTPLDQLLTGVGWSP